jgi:hypothetical protein
VASLLSSKSPPCIAISGAHRVAVKDDIIPLDKPFVDRDSVLMKSIPINDPG